MLRDVGEDVILQACLPGDGREVFHQAAVVLFAVAQFQFEQAAGEHFGMQTAVDAQDHGDDGAECKQAREAVEQQFAPDAAPVLQVADPARLQGGRFFAADVGEQLVENPAEDRLAVRRGHGQLVAIGRFATDEQAFQLELAQAPDAGGEVADQGVGLAGGECLQGGMDGR
ncbi:hypothetical protein D3C80_1427600 [compost metagenome]